MEKTIRPGIVLVLQNAASRNTIPIITAVEDQQNSTDAVAIKTAKIDPKKKSNQRKNDKSSVAIVNITADLRTSLVSQLTRNTYECIICFDVVRNQHQTWNCTTCYSIFHAKCVGNWSKTSSKTSSDWRCPGCQSVQIDAPKSQCFCSKSGRPDANRLICPHSCGAPCEIIKKCSHKCVNQCHPGPCEPCDVGRDLDVPCICRKSIVKIKCSTHEVVPQCSKPCDKILDCGIHKCSVLCHEMACGPCRIVKTVKCFCGKSEQIGDCQITATSCGSSCGFLYNCNIHRCDTKCHMQPHTKADLCPFDPMVWKTCACGKKIDTLSRGSCQDPIGTCDSPCNKLLTCGHECQMQCHLGDCTKECPEKLISKCSCGSSHFQSICGLNQINPMACQKVCDKRLHCKRHKCSLKCCDGGAHACEQICQRLLSCGLHKCMMSCGHQGKCHTCVEGVDHIQELKCDCGAMIMYPPIPCNVDPLICKRKCNRGNTCGHTITFHTCHPSNTPCPSCMVFAPTPCACGLNLLMNIPCSRKLAPSCGEPCKKISACNHTCPRVCHPGSCVDHSHPCQSKCNFQMTCGHQCVAACHGKTCPSICSMRIAERCACGVLSHTYLCGMTPIAIECDETCSAQQRKIRMAEAFEILESMEIATETWTEATLRAAKTHQETVLLTEKLLDSFLASKEPFLYFPSSRHTKLPSSKKLILEMCESYNVIAEIVDSNSKAPSIIVRRPISNIPPSIPTTLLSVAMQDVSLLVMAEPAEIVEMKANMQLKMDEITGLPFERNCIYISKVSYSMSTIDLIKSLRDIFSGRKASGTLYWVNDSEGFITYTHDDSILAVSGPDSSTLDTARTAFDRDLVLLETIRSGGTEAQFGQTHSNCFIRFEATPNTADSIKRRPVSASRWMEKLDEDGWITTSAFGNRGLDIMNFGVSTPRVGHYAVETGGSRINPNAFELLVDGR